MRLINITCSFCLGRTVAKIAKPVGTNSTEGQKRKVWTDGDGFYLQCKSMSLLQTENLVFEIGIKTTL